VRITDVTTTLLRLPRVQTNGDGLQDLLLIEIHTDAGITGIGEAHTMPTALQAIIDAPVSQWAVQGLRHLLVGEDATDIDFLWRKMWTHCGSVLGGRGLVLHAMSGIDIALWDIAGKAAGRPIHELLGQRHHDEVDVYASDLMPADADALIARAEELVAEGFTAVKFGWGKLGLTPMEDVAVLAELRRRLGDEVRLMVDVGAAMPFDDAVWLATALEPVGITFLEEPLDAADFDGYARLVAASPIPIAAGEREGGEAGFADLVDRAHLPVVQPDLARCGGFTIARRIAARATAAGAWVVPHCWSSDVLVAATVNFLVALPQPPLLEFNVMRQPLRTKLAVRPFVPVGGRLRPHDAPGLGIELDRDVIERFRSAE
jgi:L-rhamnonate dehydratase